MDSSIRWISCLNSRLRGMKHPSTKEREPPSEMKIEETLKVTTIELNRQIPASPPVLPENDEGPTSDTDNLKYIFDPLQQRLDFAGDGSPAECSDSRKRLLKGQIEAEFGSYLNEKLFVESKQDLLEWRSVNGTVFQKLGLSDRYRPHRSVRSRSAV